jgi:mannose-1-phosphate guanylyltransferase
MTATPWAIILAGGDGNRLRPLTERIAGDARPKQFCPIHEDGETLLDRARRRADLAVRPDRQVVVVSRHHAPYYDRLGRDLLPGRLVVQPENRGTAPGILYPLLHIRQMAGDVPVAIMPSDHDVVEDAAFMGYLRSAIDVVGARPGSVVLLGLEPDYPEAEYGWIEADSRALPLDGEGIFPIRRFWEKPSPRLAETLFRRGCLWNSLVMAGSVSGFLALFRAALPGLVRAFEPLVKALGRPDEDRVAESVYARLPEIGFSDRVLTASPARLLVIRAKNVGWSDWGTPSRVLASLSRNGRRPGWLSRVELLRTA